MDITLAKYKYFRDHINKMLFWGGVWPHLEHTSFYYRITTFTAVLTCFVYGSKVFGFCFANVSNMSVVVNSLSAGLSLYTILLKVVSYLLYREDLVLLDKELCKTFEEKLENEDNRPILLHDISVYRRIFYGVSGLMTVGATLFYGIPIMHAFKHKKYEFIYEGNYPFPVVPASPLYYALLFSEASTMWFLINISNGVDSAFGLHCFRACGLLRLVAQRWEQLEPNDSKSRQEICQCVQIHQLVIRSNVRLQRVYGFIVLWNYVTISLVLCSILWQANQVKDEMALMRIMCLISYMIGKSFQAFTYAFYGSRVSEESENCQEAVYFSDWPGSGNVRLMKDILIIYAQRIITLKASGYLVVTMEMFEKILNTTISYFFLLQTVESKN